MKTENHQNHTKSKKKEKPKKEKPKKDKSIFHKKSDAGKGDKIRQDITQDEWGKKWEAIFRKKESTVVVDKGSTDKSEGTA